MTNRGFTIIEVAIVLTIAGIMSAGAFKLIGDSVKSTRQTSCRDQVASAVKEITQYSTRARRLPSTGINSFMSSPQAEDAVSSTRDVYGNALVYIPAADLTQTSIANTVSDICGLSSTGLTLRTCEDAACTSFNDTENVAFVVASGAANNNIQIHNDAGNNIVRIYPSGATIDNFTADGVTNEGYDDLTGWLTLDGLKANLACPSIPFEITEDKLPPLISRNTYAQTLSVKGGVAPFQWCVESDSANVQNLTYGNDTQTVQAVGGCTDADFFQGNSINLRSLASINDIAGTDQDSALIRVLVKDSRNTQIEKQFSINILKDYHLAYSAPALPEEVDEEEEQEDDEIISGTSSSHGFAGFRMTSTYITSVASDASYITFHGTTMQNKRFGRRSSMYDAPACVWLDCSTPGVSSNQCPAFSKSKMAVYFEYTPINFGTFNYFGGTYATAYGFTFAVVKSYRPSFTYNSYTRQAEVSSRTSTASDCGESVSGLGYATRNNGTGYMYGNNFAVEFDKWQTYEDVYNKNDPYWRLNDEGHIAIVSNTSATETKWSHSGGWGWWWGGSSPYNITYGYSYNKHSGNNYSFSSRSYGYNDACSSTAGAGGCYLDPDIIQNNTTASVRIEAVSGCNSSGTRCNGSSNYICVYAWKKPKDSLSTSDIAVMKDTDKFYKFDNISSGTAVPASLGNPLVKDCFPDSTANYTLDSIRYGFTIGSGNSDSLSYTSIPDYNLKIEEFSHNLVNY